jgi:hypothetical protein
MAKSKGKRKACDCLKRVNDAMDEKGGYRLSTALRMNFQTGQASIDGPFLMVHWSGGPKRGKKLPTVACAYCPFCGKKKD